jgi:hypothetical protein
VPGILRTNGSFQSSKTMKYAKWTWTLATCFLLLGPSRASATYVVIKNISQAAPNWGDCNCIQATGWLARVFIDLLVEDNGGAYTVNIVPSARPWHAE